MHQRTASWYDVGHYTLGPLAVIVTSISAITQFSESKNDCDGWNNQAIAAAILTVMGSVIAGFITFFRFDRTSTQHRSTAAKYEAVQRDIEEVLSFDAQNREDPVTFISRQKKELNALVALNLSIPSCIINRYVKDVDAMLNGISRGDLPSERPLEQQRTLTIAPPQKEEEKKEDDYQDEFAEAIRQRLAERQEKVEIYQLNRLSTAHLPQSTTQ